MMVPSTTNSENEFADTLTALLARIEWRRAESSEERQGIFRLRYQAYLREGMIPAIPFERDLPTRPTALRMPTTLAFISMESWPARFACILGPETMPAFRHWKFFRMFCCPSWMPAEL
jgi:hypothetical protein